jgi:hypothetical protein
MTSWIEPPPKQRGMGCLGKGCLMFFIFIILLAAAFFIGGYAGVRYVVTSDAPREIPQIETTEADQRAVRERWEDFKSARNMTTATIPQDPAVPPVEGATPTPSPANRIELTGPDINQLIASSRKLNGKAFVSIENNVARIQVSVPLEKVGFRGRFLNGQFEARAAADGNPRNLEITEVSMGGVSEKVLNTLLGFRSLRSYVDQYASEYNITSLKIENNTVIIEHGGGSIPGVTR